MEPRLVSSYLVIELRISAKPPFPSNWSAIVPIVECWSFHFANGVSESILFCSSFCFFAFSINFDKRLSYYYGDVAEPPWEFYPNFAIFPTSILNSNPNGFAYYEASCNLLDTTSFKFGLSSMVLKVSNCCCYFSNSFIAAANSLFFSWPSFSGFTVLESFPGISNVKLVELSLLTYCVCPACCYWSFTSDSFVILTSTTWLCCYFSFLSFSVS